MSVGEEGKKQLGKTPVIKKMFHIWLELHILYVYKNVCKCCLFQSQGNKIHHLWCVSSSVTEKRKPMSCSAWVIPCLFVRVGQKLLLFSISCTHMSHAGWPVTEELVEHCDVCEVWHGKNEGYLRSQISAPAGWNKFIIDVCGVNRTTPVDTNFQVGGLTLSYRSAQLFDQSSFFFLCDTTSYTSNPFSHHFLCYMPCSCGKC